MSDPNNDPFNNPNTRALLTISLQTAVPLWRLQILQEGWSWDRIIREAHECAQTVAEKGDVILYRSKTKGETAKAFNALAKGLALLSFCPGGVKIFGLRWGDSGEQLPVAGALPELTKAFEQLGIMEP